MILRFGVLLVFTVLTSCNKKEPFPPDGLRKLTDSERISLVEERKSLDFDKLIIKNEDGVLISKDSVEKLSFNNDWFSDIYLNDQDEPVLAIIRKMTEADREFNKKILAIYNRVEVEPVVLLEIDCENIPEMLSEIGQLDQDTRTGKLPYNPGTDRENLEKVVSIIEKCGVPTLDDVNEEQMMAIWLVFQHGDNFHRKKYFPLLKKAEQNGDLQSSEMALMEDRILMNDGKPQIYGSQITENRETGEWMIYDLSEPETVDKRRAEVGLEPLSEYVKHWDIEFNIEQK
ncbi:MAG: DUF6624 domain-containing protein [Nonlabens sp.]